MSAADTNRQIEAVYRIESARLVAGLARMVRDIGLAEELAQDALIAALEHWPQGGIPEKPGAWLMATAKRRGIDMIRRRKVFDRQAGELTRQTEERLTASFADPDAALDDDIGDELLGLIFAACHPLLSPEARVALTLRLVAGLTTAEIARGFLVPEATIAQRIVRAKRTLGDAGLRFEVPHGTERAERLGSVLEVVYLIFNEGYSATAGDDWMRPQMSEEALRLGRILAGLAPEEPEVHGLVALMELQASRFAARRGKDGEVVLLADQDRSRWDRLLIRRGLDALDRATALFANRGPYTLQAALAACHARSPSMNSTDWREIVGLYDELYALSPSPVVALNRAVALGMAEGPAAALPLVEQLAAAGTLDGYHLLPSVRADLLARLGRHDEARAEFEHAAALTQNRREREILLARAEAEAAAIS
ncbi:MAG: RNA polymerase sigma factor [Bauldia sp.]|mgnify:CR=1 FL=1